MGGSRLWKYFMKKKNGWTMAAAVLTFAAAVSVGYYLAKNSYWGEKLPKLSEVAEQIGLTPNAPPIVHASGRAEKTSWAAKWADPRPAASFKLRDQDGKGASLSDFAGKVVLVSFIYTNCKASCPLIADEISALQRRLGPSMGAEAVFLSITLDPERDDPEALRKFGEAHGADFSSWKFLTGSSEEIQKVVSEYGVHSERDHKAGGGEIAHSNPVYLIDQWGRIRKRLDPALLAMRGGDYIASLIEQGKGH